MGDNPYVELVRQTMATLLGSAEIAEHDNLFGAGGDSMAAIRLAWRLSRETGMEVNVAEDIMAEPTPHAIAEKLLARDCQHRR
jgi:aryl carrier-like protein